MNPPNPDLQNQTDQLLVWLKVVDSDLQLANIWLAVIAGLLVLFLLVAAVFVARYRRRRLLP